MKPMPPKTIEIPKHTASATLPSQRPTTPPAAAPTPASRRLQALDLAVKNTPMTVPAISIKRPSKKIRQSDLTLSALRPTADTLVVENGDTYELQPVRISGSFGAVRIAIKRDAVIDQRFMFKEMALNKKDRVLAPKRQKNANTVNLRPFDSKQLRNEIELMLKVNSPLAPQVVLQTEDRVFLGMPPAEGDLFDAAAFIATKHPHLSAVLARTVLYDIAEALMPLDAANVSHRDIKPENILYTSEGRALLADFGLGEAHAQVTGLTGTYAYLPPEAFGAMRINWQKGVPESRHYNGKKGDMWALALTVLQVFNMRMTSPFDLACYYDNTLNILALRKEHSFLTPDDLLGFLNSSLGDVRDNMTAFAKCAEAYLKFAEGDISVPFPKTDRPDFDNYMRNAFILAPAAFKPIVQALQIDPALRPSPAQLVAAMQQTSAVVSPTEQRALAAALEKRPSSPHDSGYVSTESPPASGLVSRNHTAM